MFDKRLHQLLDDMQETLRLAGGVGLAAPQVGILRRVVIIDVGEGVMELINPVITEASEEEEEEAEGCLSFPGQYGYVSRPLRVKARAQNRDGDYYELEGEGLLARAICHETDHLDGRLFVDLASRMLEPEELRSPEEEE